MKLLLAEDEKELSRALAVILQHNGYEVECVYDGEAALERGLSEKFDGFILDIMMPKMNGIDALKALRAKHVNAPVLMLTAKAEIDDRIVGLDAGADDYLTKPFAMRELLARVRAMTRRTEEYSEPVSEENIIKCGSITLDRERLEMSNEKSTFRLVSTEFEMICLLVKNIGKAVSEKQFIEEVWENDAQTETVYLYISYLKNKLKALGAALVINKNENGYILERADSI